MSEIIINRLFSYEEFKIVPLKRQRGWMTKTTNSYAYECLPLNIANEYGWAVLCPTDFSATWNGGDTNDALEVEYFDSSFSQFAKSHFAHGILTINLDFVIQTPENVALYVRGMPNENLDGAHPLDAIVETDWLPFTFTYNYKFFKPCTINFKKGDPLFCFFPIKKGEIESYSLYSQNIKNNKKFNKEYENFANVRELYIEQSKNKNLTTWAQDIFKKSTHRYYRNARGPENQYNVSTHIKKIILSKVQKRERDEK